jgi:hypothetical protein
MSHTTTQPATKNLCCRSCWPLLLSAALSTLLNLQLAHPPLVALLHPSCLVGCCVIAQWPPSASQPAPPPLVVPSVCCVLHGVSHDACCLSLPPPLIMSLHIFALLHPPLVWLVVASRCPAPWLPPPLLLCRHTPFGVWRTTTMWPPP